jgi:hypothetical protein
VASTDSCRKELGILLFNYCYFALTGGVILTINFAKENFFQVNTVDESHVGFGLISFGNIMVNNALII